MSTRPPSPSNMPSRAAGGPSLARPAGSVRRYADTSQLPRRGLPHELGVVDTGTLYALTSDAALRQRFLLHYSGRLIVASAVRAEVLTQAGVPAARRTPENMPRCLRADDAKRLLAGPGFEVLARAADTQERFDDVLQRLRLIEDARAGHIGAAGSEREERAIRHAGETESIIIAKALLEAGTPAVLLTSDGGASLVAEAMEIPSKHIGHVIRELVCADPAHLTTGLQASFDLITRTVGTPPAASFPDGEAWFECWAVDGVCPVCDTLSLSAGS